MCIGVYCLHYSLRFSLYLPLSFACNLFRLFSFHRFNGKNETEDTQVVLTVERRKKHEQKRKSNEKNIRMKNDFWWKRYRFQHVSSKEHRWNATAMAMADAVRWVCKQQQEWQNFRTWPLHSLQLYSFGLSLLRGARDSNRTNIHIALC